MHTDGQLDQADRAQADARARLQQYKAPNYSPLVLLGFLITALLLPFAGPLLVVIIGASNHGRKGAALLVRTGIAVLVVQMVAVVAAALIAPTFLSLREQEARAAEQDRQGVSARAVLEEVMAAQRVYHSRQGSYGDLSQLQAAGLLSEEWAGAEAVSLTVAVSEGGQDYTALAGDRRGTLSATSEGMKRH